MRTLQEKYQAIQEGNYSKGQFIAEARTQLPHIITQFNGYEDIIQILKNKGILAETRLTNKSLPDYRFKPTNELDKYPYEQILRGLRVELEGMGICGVPNTDEYKQALAKVLKNLHKDEIFYTNQLAGENKNTDKKDSLVPVKVKKQEVTNSVDTFNELKKATLKEGFKKIITKILTEGEDPLRDYHQTRETENKSINEVSQNDPKIEKLVNGINTLISQAVDQDGDKIGVIWPGRTWDEPHIYEPLVYRNGQLKITCRSVYGGKPENDTVLKRDMEMDGLPLLRTLLRLYKKATKQVNESGEHDIMMRLLDTGLKSREEIQNYIKKTYPTYPEQQVTFLTNLFFDKYQ